METKENNIVAEEIAVPVESAAPSASVLAPEKSRALASRGGAHRPKNSRGPSRRGGGNERVRSEFDQKIINIRRVTRVVAGGRRFAFSVALIAGDRKGRVGVGIGKAGDTQLAIEKAMRNAKKNMITVKLTKTGSIPYEVRAKFCSSAVAIFPAAGRGLAAGGSVRNVLDLAGIRDVSAKVISGSKNRFNNAHAALRALAQIRA